MSPVFSGAADACGGVAFAFGRVTTGKPLLLGAPDTEACMVQIGRAVVERPFVRSVTVAARVPDSQRPGGGALALAREAADVLVRAGVKESRVYTVAPRTEADEPPSLRIAYAEAPRGRPVARARRVDGEGFAGREKTDLRPKIDGDNVFALDYFVTGKASRAEIALVAGGALVLSADSVVRVLESDAENTVTLELVQGGAETVPEGQGPAFEVRTRKASASGRGVQMRVSLDERGELRAETLLGEATLQTAAGEVKVGKSCGVCLRETGPGPVRNALPEPRVTSPVLGAFGVPPALAWEEVEGAARYRVEVARDADFSSTVQSHETAEPTLAGPPLASGAWFWRVTALDADGLSGAPSKIYAFEILSMKVNAPPGGGAP